LADGPRAAKDLKEAAGQDGHSSRTLHRAADDLGITKERGLWQFPGKHGGDAA